MKLDRDEQVYVRWPIVSTSHNDLTFEVQIGDTWHPTEIVDGAIRLLVCGPDRTPTDNAVPITTGRTRPRIRCTDHPEVVIVDGGAIDVGAG